jgi:hypothetical protein
LENFARECVWTKLLRASDESKSEEANHRDTEASRNSKSETRNPGAPDKQLPYFGFRISDFEFLDASVVCLLIFLPLAIRLAAE